MVADVEFDGLTGHEFTSPVFGVRASSPYRSRPADGFAVGGGGGGAGAGAGGPPASVDRQRLMDEIETLMSSLQTRAGT